MINHIEFQPSSFMAVVAKISLLSYHYLGIKYTSVLMHLARPYVLAPGACSDSEWECDDGGCIPEVYLCDGVDDCADYSDEVLEACCDANMTM